MNESSPPPLPKNSTPSLGRSLANKLLVIVASIVILQLPLYFVEAKREERAGRQAKVVGEITQAWGGVQEIHGPLLVLPIKFHDDPGGRRFLYVASSDLSITGEVKPDYLRRGIYRAQVYQADLQVEGRIEIPSEFGSANYEIDWSGSRLICVLGNTKGVSVAQPLLWQGEERSLANMAGAKLGVSGFGDQVGVDPDQRSYSFSFGVSLKGSQRLSFALLSTDSRVALQSTSSDPSFQGAILPDSREVSAEGFEASWVGGELESSTPVAWTDSSMANVLATTRADSIFGVELLSGVTDYRSIERAIKYGVLFLLTVFSGCFLGEFLGGRPLHVLNYLLVGAALCLFFLALLALAEIGGFGLAYVLAGLASTSLIVAYAKAVMQRARAVRALGLVLSGIFGYLFLVLRMEDLSLIAGTVLLFVLLGAVMFATRHLQLEEGSRSKGGAA